MKKIPGLFSIILLVLLAGAASAASSGSTTTVTNAQDAAASMYVSSYDLNPQVFFPYETGTVTVHVTNPSNTSVGLSQPDLIDPHFHVENQDAFSTTTTVGPGATADFPFIVTADPPDGTYFPLFTISPNSGGTSIHAQLQIKIDSTDIRASIATKPDNFAISRTDTVNVSITNPRSGDVSTVLIVPEVSGVDITPSEAWVGTLAAKSSVQVPFQVTPNQPQTGLTFHVSYSNGDNKHTQDIVLPLNIGVDKTAAVPVVNNIAVTTVGSYYQITGDVNNAGITDAKSLILTVAPPAKAVEPYLQYSVGSLASDDFSSFESTFTSNDLSSVPVVVQWKDADGNSFSNTTNLDLRSISGSTSGTRTGSSGSSSTTGTSAARTSGGFGGPGGGGGGGIFGFGGGSRAGGLSSFYPIIAGVIILIAGIVVYKKRKWIAAKTEETMSGSDMTSTPLIRLEDVSKVYHLETGDFTALNHVTLDITENEFVAIMGPSGSGKSTIMNQFGILDVPTIGETVHRWQECCQHDSSRTHSYAPRCHRVYLPEILLNPPSFRV